MIKVALVFPGQGAQKVGMGREFFEASPPARAVFEEADRILKNDFTQVLFEGPAEKLTSTAYCQPAILAMSIAALKAAQAHPFFKNISVSYTAGLSLGEYSALVAADALTFEEALRLVQRRAALMEAAAQEHTGKMAAVIGFEREKLMAVCRQTGAEVANFNSPEQIVITGGAAQVEEAVRQIQTQGAKSVIPLDVSGAFHSSLMKTAAANFSKHLTAVSIKNPRYPVVTNVDASPQTDSRRIKDNLARQITSSVQWVATIEYMAAQGIEKFIEIGPGKVLRGLIRRIHPSALIHNIEKPADLENLAALG